MKKILKRIYTLIPFKQEIFTLLKKVWTPKESVYRHLYFKGVFTVPIDKNHSFKIKHYGYLVENEIFWAGLTNGWEKESLKLWIKLCETSDVILDIGANTGVYSLIAKAMKPSSKVYAFEPVKRVFSKLQENILLNSYDITALEKAVSNADGIATIYDTDAEHTYSVTVNENFVEANSKAIETTIETCTLNSFIKQNNIAKIDLIKIDVETHEAEVLEGFGKHLSDYKPTLLIEVLNDEVGEKINKLVQGLDYLFFNINENGGIRQVEKITKSDYFNYLLCNKKRATELGIIQNPKA